MRRAVLGSRRLLRYAVCSTGLVYGATLCCLRRECMGVGAAGALGVGFSVQLVHQPSMCSLAGDCLEQRRA
eukprot:2309567-Rhodomonas_salina.1